MKRLPLILSCGVVLALFGFFLTVATPELVGTAIAAALVGGLCEWFRRMAQREKEDDKPRPLDPNRPRRSPYPNRRP